ncbi:transposable element tc3 transposase [Trichonephila clavipes]|nr:transposable element tc3 transposase [Trichonephila clavipes]
MVAIIQQLCGMTYDFLVGPYFFKITTPSGPSVTGTNYGAMLREQLIRALQERHCLETTICIQDGAPSHITKPVKILLRDTFGADRVISRGFENAWPPRSPDLNPYDFYLWGLLKDIVYRKRHASVAGLKSSITRHMRCVTTDILNVTEDHAILRFQHVVASDGSHIEHII